MSGKSRSVRKAAIVAAVSPSAPRQFRAAPIPDQDNPIREKVIHVPGNTSNFTKLLGDWSHGQGGPGPVGDWSHGQGYSGQLGDWSHGKGYSQPLGEWSHGMGFSRPIGDFSHGQGGTIPMLPGNTRLVGMGYHPDLPDRRDYGWKRFTTFMEAATTSRNPMRKKRATRAFKKRPKLPAAFNLGDDPKHPLPAVEDQGQTNSCTAQAAAGMLEYLYGCATRQFNDFSRMFIYYNSRKLLGWSGDTGAYIRTVFKAMRLFGVPPEAEWPFDLSFLDIQPMPYQYAYAENFKTISYARLDGYGDRPTRLYDRIKKTVYAGFPVEFGFPIYGCIQTMRNFIIPVPSATDRLLGGHAVLAVGYNNRLVWGKDKQGKDLKGALIIRNSWGPDWADHGYGFLPRWYIDEGYASDFWTAYDETWLKLGDFD